MAKSVRIRLNKKGVGELLKSEGVKEDLRRRIKRVEAAAEADPNMDGITANVNVYTGHDRARASIGIPPAIEARYGVLARALRAAGD